MQRNIKKQIWPYLFILPMVILFVVFTIYPLLASVRYTFYNWDGIGIPRDFVGLKHYFTIAKDPFFWNAFKNTFFYTGVVTFVQIAVALVLATILNSKSLKFNKVFRMIFFSPVLTSPAIVGIVISLLVISGGGIFSQVLRDLGWIEKPVDWLGNPYTAIWIVITVGIWLGLGYPLIYFLAGLQSINQDLYNAARVDGAGEIALYRHITMPLLRPIIVVVLLLITLRSLRVFDTVQVMTKGGPYFATDVVGTYIYRYTFVPSALGDIEANLGFASAAAFFMGVLVMVISIILVVVMRYVSIKRFTDL
jgi:ABC-type sugar transport system permease subunit